MKKKRLKHFVLSILFSIIFLALLSFTSASRTVVSPASNTNYSASTLVVFNVSYVNGSDFTDAQNATFYYNLSGVWTYIGSTLDCNNGATFGSCNGTLNVSGLTDGRYSINATLSNATTTASNVNSSGASVLTTNVVFDKTPPAVSFSGITNTVNYGNYTGSILIINVSVIDSLMEVDRVYFNVTFPNGTQVNYTRAINSGNYYNITLDTSTFTDGGYNITVYANDSLLNNRNQTERIYVTFDKTAPTGSIVCSPSTVYLNEVVTCNCGGSDATSGVSTPSSSSNPSTTQTGDFTVACTILDYAGNSFTSAGTYIVEMATTRIKPKPTPIQNVTLQPEIETNKTQISKDVEEKKSAWVWIVVSVLFLALIFFFLFKKKSKLRRFLKLK